MSTSAISEVKLLAKQSTDLKQVLTQHPSLKNLCFQGKPIVFYSTKAGFLSLSLSRLFGNFDQVAQNHGIRRIRRIGYNDDLIWSIDQKVNNITFKNLVTEKLEKNFKTIEKEVRKVIKKREKFPDSDELTNKTGLWSWLSFFNKDGSDNFSLQAECPKTSEIVKSLSPNLQFGFCFISILEPNTTIAAHKGSSSLRYRYHLCIDADVSGKCGIRVGRKWIKWKVGKAFGFNDALEHEVIYTGKKPRVVLIIDLWPETCDPEFFRTLSKNSPLLQLGTFKSRNTTLAVND